MVNMKQNANLQDFLSLTKKQQEYINIKAQDGLSDTKIAEKIDINRSTISRWKNDEKFLKGQRGFQAQYLHGHVPDAMRKMVDLLDARSELVSYQAAKDILDRAGYVLSDEDLTYRESMNKLEVAKKKLEIKKLEKDIATDTSTEDKLREYFDALSGAIEDE